MASSKEERARIQKLCEDFEFPQEIGSAVVLAHKIREACPPKVIQSLLAALSEAEARAEAAEKVTSAVLSASVFMAESMEKAYPELHDNHETDVMKAFVKMHEAHVAAAKYSRVSDEDLAEFENSMVLEMQRIIELANADRDRLAAKLERVRDLADAHHQECIDTDGNDCSVDRQCPRQDACWVTWIRRAITDEGV